MGAKYKEMDDDFHKVHELKKDLEYLRKRKLFGGHTTMGNTSSLGLSNSIDKIKKRTKCSRRRDEKKKFRFNTFSWN